MLRPYQRDAIELAERDLLSHKNTLIILPTGTGKTVIFSEIIKRWVAKKIGRVMVIAQQGHLLEQAYRTLTNDAFGGFSKSQIDFEIADRRVSDLFVPDIVLASKDSLHKRRRERFAPDSFSLLVIDEAHHSPAKSYKGILEYFSSSVVLGVTATPIRHDKKPLSIFENVSYTYELVDAIKDGFLAPIRYDVIPLSSVHLSSIRITKKGDFDELELDDAMRREEPVLQVARTVLEVSSIRPTLIFCTSIQHAEDVAESINRHRPNSARAVHSKSENRDMIFADFLARKFQYLVNVDLVTEGFDFPPISCVVMAAPTMSIGKYTQRIGRGTRLCDGKSDLYVVDFIGELESIEPVGMLDVIGGDVDTDVRKRVQRRGSTIDIITALEQAEQEIGRERRLELLAGDVTFVKRRIDPFLLLGISPRGGRYSGKQITDGQRDLLLKFGVSKKDIAKMDMGQAAEVLREIKRRRDTGLCSYRQSRKLLSWGINPDISKDAARRIFDVMQRHEWRLTEENLSYIRYVAKMDRRKTRTDNFITS